MTRRPWLIHDLPPDARFALYIIVASLAVLVVLAMGRGEL